MIWKEEERRIETVQEESNPLLSLGSLDLHPKITQQKTCIVRLKRSQKQNTEIRTSPPLLSPGTFEENFSNFPNTQYTSNLPSPLLPFLASSILSNRNILVRRPSLHHPLRHCPLYPRCQIPLLIRKLLSKMLRNLRSRRYPNSFLTVNILNDLLQGSETSGFPDTAAVEGDGHHCEELVWWMIGMVRDGKDSWREEGDV